VLSHIDLYLLFIITSGFLPESTTARARVTTAPAAHFGRAHFAEGAMESQIPSAAGISNNMKPNDISSNASQRNNVKIGFDTLGLLTWLAVDVAGNF